MSLDAGNIDSHIGGAHDEETGKARTRVSQACARCRTRKDRCDGQRPSCTNCVNKQLACSYEAGTKKRGLPEGYVRGLEKLLALLIGKIHNFEGDVTQLFVENRDQLARIWKDPVVVEDLHSTWKESRIYHELESLLSKLDNTGVVAGQKRKREREDTGSSVDKPPTPTFHTEVVLALTPSGSTPTSATLPRSIISPTESQRLPDDVLSLIDQYFAYTHCWFPIVHRPQVTKSYYEFTQGISNDSNETTQPLIWAICAYAAAQVQSRSTQTVNVTNSTAPDRSRAFRARSLHILSVSKVMSALEHAQAYLILALLDTGLNDWQSAWTNIGHAIRMVVSMPSASVPSCTAVVQGCAVLDIAAASHLHVTPHMHGLYVQGIILLDEDGYEEWEPWHTPHGGVPVQREPSFGISCFNRLTQIFKVIGDALELDFDRSGHDQTHVQALLANLHQLQAALPGRTAPTASSPPHHIYLRLFHVAAQIRMIELFAESDVGPTERAKLACNVLSLCSLCKVADTSGLSNFPPLLADCLAASLRLAADSKGYFGAATGLPSYDEFERTAQNIISELSMTWPLYTHHHQNGCSASPVSQTAQNQIPRQVTSAPVSLPATVIPYQDRAHNPERRFDRPGLTSHPNDVHRVSLRFADSIPRPPGQPQQYLGLQNDNTTSSPYGYELYNNVSVPPALVMQQEPSPSFQGDEIDAIFREMAYLDTNEWSSEQAGRLKDFGFADDLTFQAFCNDSDRLMVEDGSLQQPMLSSNAQTWTFTDPGGTM